MKRVKRWSFSLRELLNDPVGREQFTKFLDKEFSGENLKYFISLQFLQIRYIFETFKKQFIVFLDSGKRSRIWRLSLSPRSKVLLMRSSMSTWLKMPAVQWTWTQSPLAWRQKLSHLQMGRTDGALTWQPITFTISWRVIATLVT